MVADLHHVGTHLGIKACTKCTRSARLLARRMPSTRASRLDGYIDFEKKKKTFYKQVKKSKATTVMTVAGPRHHCWLNVWTKTVRFGLAQNDPAPPTS